LVLLDFYRFAARYPFIASASAAAASAAAASTTKRENQKKGKKNQSLDDYKFREE